MGNEIFEEIKRKYKNSNKYMLCLSYEDIGNLIRMVEILDKQIKRKRGIKMDEIIISILKEYIKQYDKANTMNVAIMSNGRSVTYKKIKMTETQKLFFEQYIDMKGE